MKRVASRTHNVESAETFYSYPCNCGIRFIVTATRRGMVFDFLLGNDVLEWGVVRDHDELMVRWYAFEDAWHGSRH